VAAVDLCWSSGRFGKFCPLDVEAKFFVSHVQNKVQLNRGVAAVHEDPAPLKSLDRSGGAETVTPAEEECRCGGVASRLLRGFVCRCRLISSLLVCSALLPYDDDRLSVFVVVVIASCSDGDSRLKRELEKCVVVANRRRGLSSSLRRCRRLSTTMVFLEGVRDDESKVSSGGR
jgi:hypothetical protein